MVTGLFKIGGHYYIRTMNKELLEKASYGGVASAILYYLLSEKKIDYAIAVKSFGITSGKPVFIDEPNKVLEIAGSFTIAPINISRILRDYTKIDEKIAVIVKPCEEKAIKYLIDNGKLRRENLFIIGLNCGGLFDPISLARNLEEKNIKPEDVKLINYTDKHIELVLRDNTTAKIDRINIGVKTGYRDACRRCLLQTPEISDVALGYWGVLPDYSKYTYTIPLTEKGCRILTEMYEKGLIEAVEVPEEGRRLRENIINIVRKSAEIYRQKEYELLDEIGVDKLLSKCLLCLECWHVCPIRSEKEVLVWKKKIDPIVWQISVVSYMYDKCVECGSCEDVCPVGIPFSLIIQRIKDLRKELGI